MTDIELKTILENHEKWLRGEAGGCIANLHGVDLRGFDLSGVDLRGADLSGTILRGTNLSGANLCTANLCGAVLSGANLHRGILSGANLCGAMLCCANLMEAELCRVDFGRANLSQALLSRANLYRADLYGADLRGVDLGEAINLPYIPMTCPEVGSFIGWKKAHHQIVKLQILEDALRSSSTGRKCRCNKALILAIENLDGSPSNLKSVCSDYDESFVYTVGEIVESDFCMDRFIECATGIHFFINRQEAVEY